MQSYQTVKRKVAQGQEILTLLCPRRLQINIKNRDDHCSFNPAIDKLMEPDLLIKLMHVCFLCQRFPLTLPRMKIVFFSGLCGVYFVFCYYLQSLKACYCLSPLQINDKCVSIAAVLPSYVFFTLRKIHWGSVHHYQL